MGGNKIKLDKDHVCVGCGDQLFCSKARIVCDSCWKSRKEAKVEISPITFDDKANKTIEIIDDYIYYIVDMSQKDGNGLTYIGVINILRNIKQHLK